MDWQLAVIPLLQFSIPHQALLVSTTLIKFLKDSSLIPIFLIGSKHGTPSGNRRLTSSAVFRRSSRWSILFKSLGNWTRIELIKSIVDIVTGTISILPNFSSLPGGPGLMAGKSFRVIREPFLTTEEDASSHNATSMM